MLVIKKNSLIFCLALFILACSIGAVPVRQAFKSGKRNLPVYSVEREDNRVALTFNCAWGDEDIDEILSALKEKNAKATFFLVGEWAEKYPQSAKKIADAGHELGGHSYNHKDYAKMSAVEVEKDSVKTAEIIKSAAGKEAKLVRAPSGSYNNSAIEAIENAGFIPIQWSVDSIDYGGTKKPTIIKRVTEKTRTGDIILMHTGTDNTAAALPEILENLCGKYELCTVSELLYGENSYVDSAGEMHKNN